VHSWTLGFTDHDDAERYRDMANRIQDTLDFMTAAGLTGDQPRALHGRFLHQPRGAAAGIRRGADRLDSTSGKWLAGSGHMIWIGDRTRQPDGAHVEFAAACRTRSA
jgi:3-deoxy-7-phosphoheptulonate synthase